MNLTTLLKDHIDEYLQKAFKKIIQRLTLANDNPENSYIELLEYPGELMLVSECPSFSFVESNPILMGLDEEQTEFIRFPLGPRFKSLRDTATKYCCYKSELLAWAKFLQNEADQLLKIAATVWDRPDFEEQLEEGRLIKVWNPKLSEHNLTGQVISHNKNKGLVTVKLTNAKTYTADLDDIRVYVRKTPAFIEVGYKDEKQKAMDEVTTLKATTP